MRRAMLLSASLLTLAASAAFADNATPHNLILFVPDGLRALKVTPETAPATIVDAARRSARSITAQREQTARRVAAKLGFAVSAAGME